jgi:hypothetical protein
VPASQNALFRQFMKTMIFLKIKNTGLRLMQKKLLHFQSSKNKWSLYLALKNVKLN